MKPLRPTRLITLLLTIVAAMLVVAVAAPLRGAALGEPTVLHLQRFAAVTPSIDDQLSALAAGAPGFPFTGSSATPNHSDSSAHGLSPFTPPGRLVEHTPPTFTEVDSIATASRELHRPVRVPQLPEDVTLGPPSISVFTASS